jgi:hypothetical protein
MSTRRENEKGWMGERYKGKTLKSKKKEGN